MFVEKSRLTLRTAKIDLAIQQSGSARTATGRNYAEGDYLFTFNTERMYAHYYNSVLYAAYQDGSNFRPQHWLTATGLMNATTASCFAENDPRTTGSGTGGGSVGGATGNPTSNTNTSNSSGICSVSKPNGHVDLLNSTTIQGWAFDESHLENTLMVDIYIDGTKVTTVEASNDRSDLVIAFKNPLARYHGFSVDLFYLQNTPKGYRITVKVCGTSSILREEQVYFSQRTATVDDNDDPTKPKDSCKPVVLFRRSGKSVVTYECDGGVSSSGGTPSEPNPSTNTPSSPSPDIPPALNPETPYYSPNPTTGSGGIPNTPSDTEILFSGQPIATKANLEGVDCDKISGWAYAKNGGYAYLDIYITDPTGGSSGRLIKVATIKSNNISRPDVRAYYGNNPNIPLDCGFQWGIPDFYKTGQPLTVKVVPANDISPTGNIDNSPKTSSGSCNKPSTTDPNGTTGPWTPTISLGIRPTSFVDLSEAVDMSDEDWTDWDANPCHFSYDGKNNLTKSELFMAILLNKTMDQYSVPHSLYHYMAKRNG